MQKKIIQELFCFGQAHSALFCCKVSHSRVPQVVMGYSVWNKSSSSFGWEKHGSTLDISDSDTCTIKLESA